MIKVETHHHNDKLVIITSKEFFLILHQILLTHNYTYRLLRRRSHYITVKYQSSDDDKPKTIYVRAPITKQDFIQIQSESLRSEVTIQIPISRPKRLLALHKLLSKFTKNITYDYNNFMRRYVIGNMCITVKLAIAS